MLKYHGCLSFGMKTGFSVLDAMTRKPIQVSRSTTVLACAQLMEQENIGNVLVVSNGVIEGIVVEEDIVRRVVAVGKSPKTTRVKDIMTTSVVTVQPTQDIYDALVLMRDHTIRTLPVVNEGALLGILTVKDILKIEPDLFDIIADKWQIREPERKPLFGESRIEFIDD